MTAAQPVTSPGATETLSGALARFVASLSLDKTPPVVVHRAKLYCLDTLVVTLAGASAQSSAIIAGIAEAQGGRPDCTLIGRQARAPVLIAGLVNGSAAHAVELDDDHRTSVLHPGTVVVPAALAMAEHCRASGATLIAAIIAGYDVVTRIGDAFLGQQYYTGFHSTGTCGVFGAAAAAARILGLSVAQTTTALGIAGTQGAGLGEWANDGSWIKRLHPGKAAEAGILAALLARDGFTAPATILEGGQGFLKAFSNRDIWDADKIVAGLGEDYRGHGTSFKPYAGCRFSHQVVDAVLELVAAHEIGPEDVDSVHVRIHTTSYRKLFQPAPARYQPKTPVDAQFSIPYIVATALIDGRPLPHHFTEQAIREPARLAMAARVKGEPDDEYERQYPARYPSHVTITLRDGRSHAAYCDLPSGDPEHARYAANPARFERELMGKIDALFGCMGQFADRCAALVAEVMGLDKAPDIARLARLLAL